MSSAKGWKALASWTPVNLVDFKGGEASQAIFWRHQVLEKKKCPQKMGLQIHWCQDTGGWSLKGCCPTFTIIAPLSPGHIRAMSGTPTSAGISSAASCNTVSKAGLSKVATLTEEEWWMMDNGWLKVAHLHSRGTVACNFCPKEKAWNSRLLRLMTQHDRWECAMMY